MEVLKRLWLIATADMAVLILVGEIERAIFVDWV